MSAGDDAGAAMAMGIHGPISPADLPGLCNRVCSQLAGCTSRVVRCDVRSIAPDAVTVDALARLQLAATRHGCRIHLVGASANLRQLVALMGLNDVLPEVPDDPRRS